MLLQILFRLESQIWKTRQVNYPKLKMEEEGIIDCWGHRDDMHEVLPLASIVVLPSYERLPKDFN